METYTEKIEILVAEPETADAVAVPAAKPDGPMAAALLAAGIGSFALGLFTTLAEASPGFRGLLLLNDGVGPLSGKTVYAVVIFAVAWIALHFLLRHRDGLLRTATIAFLVLLGLGLLGTFPIFFEAFAPE